MEGVLALEDFCFEKGITNTGEILFTRKVDMFLACMLRIIVDACYSLETNQSYLKNLMKYSSRRTKLLLRIASVCMDGIANGKDIKNTIVDIFPYIGLDNQRTFWDLFYKLRDQVGR